MHSDLPSAQPTQPKKAGIFLYGWDIDTDGQRRLFILSPWTEGRFGHGLKYYGLSKGAIDAGETPLQAAVRETDEEGGISVADMMGRDTYTRFLGGEVIRDLPSDGYPGVGIVHASPQPVVEQDYFSGQGNPHRAVYYAVEVSNILKLSPYLKHIEPGERPEETHVRTRASQIVKDRHLPNNKELRDILRTGVVPARTDRRWAEPHAQILLEKPALPALEKTWLAKHRPDLEKISSTRDWLEFLNDLPGKDEKRLSHDFDVVKRYMEKRGMVGDSNALPKLDTKDNPMNIYREDGALITLESMLRNSWKGADSSTVYGAAVWGDSQGKHRKHLSPDERLASSQISPLIRYFATIAPMELAAACIEESHGKNRRPQPVELTKTRAAGMLKLVDAGMQHPSWKERVLEAARARLADDPALAKTRERL